MTIDNEAIGAPPSLVVENLRVRAGDSVLLAPISLTLHSGRALTIVGETGAGKSLLAQALMGNLPAGLIAEGRVFLGETELLSLPASKRRRLWGRAMTLLPQEPWLALDPLMRVRAQISETWRYVAGLARRDARAAAEADLERLGISQAGAQLPMTLSGGMAQRAAFAAARAGGAPLTLADEPTKGLDAARRDDIATLLRDTLARGGSLLTITHDIEVARRLGGDLLVVRGGRVLEQGPVEAVLESPRSDYARALIEATPERWPVTPPLPSRPPEKREKPVLSAHRLSVARGGRTLFRDVSLSLYPGEIVGIKGPSGSGKSTLGDLLLGLLPPDEGRVERCETLSPTRFQKLYQDPPAAMAPWWTLGLLLKDLTRRHRLDHSHIEALMARLGLDAALLKRRPGAVSGGELQRFAILRALLLKPALLFADEPTSRLDPITQRDTLALLTALAREQGCALVLVSHDDALIERLCDRTLTLTQALPDRSTSEGQARQPSAKKRR